jgi:type II restriction/modification system DNA methylase subunit YeeA
MLNPETITVLDPACGSGHILVEAFDVLKAIYLERGYRMRDIPRLILEKNLYGLDIDERAAQLAGFALLMKARADDRRLLDNPPKLNVLALQESKGLDADEIVQSLNTVRAELVEGINIRQLVDTFAHAHTFGSLIQIPPDLNAQLPAMDAGLQLAIQSGDLLAQAAALNLLPLVRQARILGMRFDAVVANPPYMGGKGMNAALKNYAKQTFPDSKSDLFAMFIERGFEWCKPSGFNSMVTMQSWMFLSSYQAMREKLLGYRTINTMAHLGARAFSEVSGEVVQTTAFVLQGKHLSGFKPVFFRLVDGNEEQKQTALLSGQNRFDSTVQDDFKKISGSPVAYWMTKITRSVFVKQKSLSSRVVPKIGLATTNNERFIRYWYEVNFNNIDLNCTNNNQAKNSNKKWFPFNKGGDSRKWFGNIDFVVNWGRNGIEIKKAAEGASGGRINGEDFYFKDSISASAITSSGNSYRFYPTGAIFDVNFRSYFDDSNTFKTGLLGFLNSKVVNHLLSYLSPTVALNIRDLDRLPLCDFTIVNPYLITKLIVLSRTDWDNIETSRDFTENPLFHQKQNTLEKAFNQWQTQNRADIEEMQRLEEENNRLFIETYGLEDELSPDVPEEQITLARADREKDCQRLISYAIGCMMGRYNLDEPGLIYAHAGNAGFDPARYQTFPADTDGIVPITDELWFDDDAANRIREFLLAVWGNPSPQPSPQGEGVEANLAWLAESLGQRGNETPIETIRRYLAGGFFKDHLQTYKERPIYWLFSSGKQGAFQALVYLHRYHESTLARMRAEYVVPLTGKIQSRIEMLEKDAAVAASNSTRSKLNKDIEKLKKKHVELLAYDEKLRHYADLRIQLDLDDGVKVNYGKFGDLLAEVKAVTGGSADE